MRTSNARPYETGRRGAAELSGGISYDEVGIRFNDGKLTFSQRFSQGFEFSIGAPVASLADELFREYSFESALSPFSERNSGNIDIFGIGGHVGIGGAISVAFDVKYFFNCLNDIFGE